jgi:hypothetical protein
MLPPNSREWPIWHDDPWQDRQLHTGLVPLRHDIALEHYLEKQRACRVSTVSRLDPSSTAIRRCLPAHALGAVFSGACAPLLPAGRRSDR